MLDARPYSYRDDPAVPQFEDSGPVVFMDGACALCTGAARLIARLDKAGDFRICPVESALGQRVLTHYGLDPRDPETWLYLEEGRAYGSLAGVLRAARRLGGWARVLAPLGVLPRPVQDWIYRRIARNRLKLFGRAEMCAVPDVALRARLLG